MISNLGLTVNVAEILDVKAFRETFFFGTVLEHAISSSSDFIRTSVDWNTLPPDRRPKDAAEARAIVVNTMRGNMPDTAVLEHLRSALSWAEVQVGIPLQISRIVSEPVDDGVREGIDYDEVAPRLAWRASHSDFMTRIELPKPILSVQRIRAFVNGQLAWSLSADDYEITLARQGVIKLRTSISNVTPSAWVPMYTTINASDNLWQSPLRVHKAPTLPGFWAVDYTTGPIINGRVGYVPSALRFLVWAHACRYVWSLDGMVISKGIASQSRSIDGISNSASLTASAMYGLNSAIETVTQDYLKAMPWSTLRNKMAGFKIRGL